MTYRDINTISKEITMAEIYEKGERLALAAQTKEGQKAAKRFIDRALLEIEDAENEDEYESFRKKVEEDIRLGRYNQPGKGNI